MGSKDQRVEVGKRKLELSNLDKVLYPEDGFVKAEVIDYYLRIAPTMLYHIRGRPLTLIRYPEGIHGQRFYQKNSPDWAPAWIETELLGEEEKKDYVLGTEQAGLVWLANLASLELHQMHCRKPRYDQPDYMVFDLDPPEEAGFETVTDLAFRLKEHIEDYGYHTFVKTTGGKGVHLVVPLEPDGDFDAVFGAAKDLSLPFVSANDDVTLQIRKKERKGRILIDIYRNRARQSIVSPYSLRGKPGAPVSMPLTWDELAETGDSGAYTLGNAIDKVIADGDAWEGIGGYSVQLHTRRKAAAPVKELPESEHRKTPAQLEEYDRKRDFNKTTEPGGSGPSGAGNRFVIHRHHATRLHYDLRLEEEGVLRSWAVPKGFPPRPGVKRLAVQTEDHPLEYLTFSGTIPKGEYGGGEMWIYATGKYEITREKKNGLYFRLDSPELSGEYRMHRMKEKEWLLEKTEEPQVDWLNDLIEPMHAERTDTPPQREGYVYEVKWDGIRALIALEDGSVRIRTRNQNDVTKQFPELHDAAGAFRATGGLFDGEIVCLDKKGRPAFQQVINRLRSTGKSTIEKLSQTNPVHCYLFDCLYLDGRSLIHEPLMRRYEWLTDSVKKGTSYRVSEMVEDGEGLFRAAREHGLEGIMAKKSDSRYLPGRRSDLWLKVKVTHTVDCRVIGYTRGEGDRKSYFGALHLAEEQNGELRYRGKVGTGFDDTSIKEVDRELKKVKKASKPIDDTVKNEKNNIWIEPELVIEVTYGRLSENGIFKEAVFNRMRPDLS